MLYQIKVKLLDNRSTVSDALTWAWDDSPSNGILKYHIMKKSGNFLTDLILQSIEDLMIFTF